MKRNQASLLTGAPWSILGIALWNVAVARCQETAATRPAAERVLKDNSFVFAVAFSPDGKTLASGTGAGVRLWDLKSGALRRSIVERWGDEYPFSTSLAFSPDGSTVAIGVNSGSAANRKLRMEVTLWDVATGQQRFTLRHSGSANLVGPSLAFSPDGRSIAAIVAYPAFDQAHGKAPKGDTTASAVLVWDAQSRRVQQRLARWFKSDKGTRQTNPGIVFYAPDGRTLGTFDTNISVPATKGDGWNMALWDTRRGQLQRVVKFPTFFPPTTWFQPSSGALSPDGRTVAAWSFSDAASLGLWEAHSGRLLHHFNLKGGIKAGAFSPDSKWLAVSRFDPNLPGEVGLWDVSSGKLLRTLPGHPPATQFTTVAFSPDGALLAGGSLNGTVHLWRIH